jgi:hypothetical protein
MTEEIEFADYLPVSLVTALQAYIDWEHRILEEKWKRRDETETEELRERWATYRQRRLPTYHRRMACLRAMGQPSDEMWKAVAAFGFESADHWEWLIRAVLFASEDHSAHRVNVRRARTQMIKLVAAAEQLDLMAEEFTELMRKLPRGWPATVSFGWKRRLQFVWNWQDRLNNEVPLEERDSFLAHVQRNIIDARQLNKKTAFVRALGYHLTLPYETEDGERRIIDLEPNVVRGIAHVANAVLDDPNDDVSYDTVRKALRPAVIEKNRLAYERWREARHRKQQEYEARRNSRALAISLEKSTEV